MSHEVEKVAVVGPHKPYPGGIGEHTTNLGDFLGKIVEVRRFAYANIFPARFYPGKYDGDFRGRTDLRSDVNYLLEYNRPKTWRRLLNELDTFKPDLVILPWWTFFHAPHLIWLSRRLKKLGMRVLFLCHNVCDHEANWVKRFLCETALKQAGAFLTHATTELSLLSKVSHGTPVLLTPHPVSADYPKPEALADAPVGKTRFLCLGFVRPYKGVDVLAEAFDSEEFKDDHLIVAGEWWEGCRQHQDRLRGMSNVTLVPKYLSKQEVADLYGWADVAVLPYRSATGSGVAATAIHFRKPVVVSRTASLGDIFVEGESGFFAEPSDAVTLRQALVRSRVVAESGSRFDDSLSKLADDLDWTCYVRKILEFAEASMPPSKR